LGRPLASRKGRGRRSRAADHRDSGEPDGQAARQPSADLLLPRLDQIINMKHPLVLLAEKID
jgi:hypothetical protein